MLCSSIKDIPNRDIRERKAEIYDIRPSRTCKQKVRYFIRGALSGIRRDIKPSRIEHRACGRNGEINNYYYDMRPYRADIVSQDLVHVKRYSSEQEVPSEVTQGIGSDQSQERSRCEYFFPWDLHFRGYGRPMAIRAHDQRSLLLADVFLLLRGIGEEYMEHDDPNKR